VVRKAFPQAEAGPPQGLGQDLQAESAGWLAGKELDKAAKWGWDWLKGQIGV